MTESYTPVRCISKLILMCRNPLFDKESRKILLGKKKRVAYVEQEENKIPVKVIGAIIYKKAKIPIYIVSYDNLGIWGDDKKTEKGNIFYRNDEEGKTTLFNARKLKNEDDTEWTGVYTLRDRYNENWFNGGGESDGYNERYNENWFNEGGDGYNENWFNELFGYEPGEPGDDDMAGLTLQ